MAYYDVTGQFDTAQWNGTSFQLAGYTLRVLGHRIKGYAWPGFTLEVSNGRTSQNTTFPSLGGWGGIPWPPRDFPLDPVAVFHNEVVVHWYFTCDMQVFLEVTVHGP